MRTDLSHYKRVLRCYASGLRHGFSTCKNLEFRIPAQDGADKFGNRVSDISFAVESHARASGLSVVRELSGHGVGIELHEEPQIPNFGPPGRGMTLSAGMTICIEPMVNLGSARVKTLKNGWTVVTADGSASAHFEHTVLVREGTAEILTRLN